jgi:hypothetical protein
VTETATVTLTLTETAVKEAIIEEDSEDDEKKEKEKEQQEMKQLETALLSSIAATTLIIHTDTPRNSNIAVITSAKSRKLSVMKQNMQSGIPVLREDLENLSRNTVIERLSSRKSSIGQTKKSIVTSETTSQDDTIENDFKMKVQDEDSLVFPSLNSPFLQPLSSPPLQTISDNDEYDKDEQEAELNSMLSSVLASTPPPIQSDFSQTLNYSESGSECSSLNVTTGTPFKLLKSARESPSSSNFNSPLIPMTLSPNQRNSILEKRTITAVSSLLFPVQVRANDDFLSPPESTEGVFSSSPLGFPVPEDKMVEMFGTGFHLDDNNEKDNNNSSSISSNSKDKVKEEEEDNYDDDDFET